MNRDDVLVWLSLAWLVALCGAAIWVLFWPAYDIFGVSWSTEAFEHIQGPDLYRNDQWPFLVGDKGTPMEYRTGSKVSSRVRSAPDTLVVSRSRMTAFRQLVEEMNHEHRC